MHKILLATALAAALLAPSVRPVAAQTEIEILPRAATLTIGGRLQPQFQTSSVDDAASDLFIRRARLRIDIEVSDFLDARVNPDFSGGEPQLQDAWVRLSFAEAFRLSVGQFKRAFSAFELASSTDLPVIERDGRIAGLDACPEVGGPCTFSRLTERLSFDGRDQGVRVEGTGAGGRMSWMGTVTNGEGTNAGDVNDAKSVSGRLEWQAGAVRLGAFAGVHDHEEPGGDGDTDTEWAPAGGADVEIGTWRDGFHLLGAAAVGDNWRVGPEADFTTVQILASYYSALGGPRLTGLEPLFRVSWSDTGTDSTDAGGILLTPGVMLYFSGKNGISFNVDVWRPEGAGDTEYSLKAQTYLYF